MRQAACAVLAAAAASFSALHVNRYAVEDGERLLRGFPGISGWEMPVLPLISALAESVPFYGLLTAPFAWACVLAAFALGSRLHSRGIGAFCAAAAAGFLWLESRSVLLDLAFVMQTTAFLAAAALWNDEKIPLRRRAHALGLIAGAAVWVRTSSLLLPAVFLAYELLRGRGGLKHAARELWPAAVWPVLLLLPWTLLHWREAGRFLLLEAGRADSNLIAGALGLAGTMEGDARALAGLPAEASAAAWAAQEALRHPAQFAAAFARRVLWTLSWHPILAGAAAAAAWRLRRNRAIMRTALLAAAYWLVHCLVAVEQRYLPPLWLLSLCIVGAAWPGTPSPEKTKIALGLCLLPLFAAYLPAAALCLRRPPAKPFDFAAAAAARPDDAWVLSELGRMELEAGLPGAAGSLLRAYALRPDLKRGFDLALGQIAGARRLPIGDRPFYDYLSDPEAGWAGRLLIALAELDAGRYASARRAYDEAALLYARTELRARGPFAADRAALERLRLVDAGLRRSFDALILRLPYALRLELAGRLPQMGLENSALVARLTPPSVKKEN